MFRQIHEHEVLKMMLESDKIFTPAELTHEIVSHFGEDARFYNCSFSNMEAASLVDKLDREGNFLIISESFLKGNAF